MRLAIISSLEIVTADHISTIDKICHHLWDCPSIVRYYNLITESSDNREIASWAELYFGCRFVNDTNEKLPRIKSAGSFSNLAGMKPLHSSSGSSSSPRSNSPSPRLHYSPRTILSPRKLSPLTASNLQVMAANCDHVIILGAPDNLGLLLKALDNMTVIVFSNP